MNFCEAILIVKMRGKKLHFLAYFALFYQLKCKKRFVQCMEKMLWLTEHFRSGLQFHAEDFSLDETFHGQVDQLKLIAIKWRHWEQSVLYHTKIAGHTQNIQIKHWKKFVVMFIALMFGFHISYAKKKRPNKPKTTLLAGISTCDSLIKCNKTVLFLKQLMTGHEKWILYNNVDWRRSWGKRNELPPTTPEASLHPKKVMLCLQWDWKGVL